VCIHTWVVSVCRFIAETLEAAFRPGYGVRLPAKGCTTELGAAFVISSKKKKVLPTSNAGARISGSSSAWLGEGRRRRRRRRRGRGEGGDTIEVHTRTRTRTRSQKQTFDILAWLETVYYSNSYILIGARCAMGAKGSIPIRQLRQPVIRLRQKTRLLIVRRQNFVVNTSLLDLATSQPSILQTSKLGAGSCYSLRPKTSKNDTAGHTC
jgi:hypothetical protein